MNHSIQLDRREIERDTGKSENYLVNRKDAKKEEKEKRTKINKHKKIQPAGPLFTTN